MPPVLPPALTLGFGFESDDDELGDLPTSLSKSGGDDAKKMQESYMLSQSGTFKVEDFNISKGGLLPASERDGPHGTGNPGPQRGAAAAAGLDVQSMDELEIFEELGSGASGTVFRARHKPTDTEVAVKQVTILEKTKRDQVVAELRIMRKHLSPWLVALYNAFYEEAKVHGLTLEQTPPSRSPATVPRAHRCLFATPIPRRCTR